MYLSLKTFLSISFITLFCATLLGVGLYFYNSSNADAATPEKNSEKATLNENKKAEVGEFIMHPAVQANKMLKVKVTGIPTVISEAEALKAVQNTGIPWALGGLYNDKTISISSVYGLATLGFAGDTSNIFTSQGTQPTGACANWIGPCNFPILNCNLGKCTDTGRVIERFVDRPMWVVDYGNVMWQNGGSGQPAPTSNHTVYLVDALEKVAIVAWGYQGN